MKYNYDVITIGLGPAGMAVSIMGSEMGLKVCAMEKHKIGGECMNVGCIPSKSLLRIAKTRNVYNKLKDMELDETKAPDVKKPFEKIASYIKYINEKKTVGMFKKVDLQLGKGSASFVDRHTVEVDGKKFTSKNIFICTGTKPAVPPIPGVEGIEYLTNESMFNLNEIPKSLTVIGGGAIGCEMAQAFSRLGAKVTIVQMDKHLLPFGSPNAGEILESVFQKENIDVLNSRKITKVEKVSEGIALYTEQNERIVSEKILFAAGRSFDFSELKLENVGVNIGKRGIPVDKNLRTNVKNIFAVGDCNGQFLLSHSAMHQGMLALMNCMIPWPFKYNFKKFPVPWTVFTEPQVSYVGLRESELQAKGIKYEVIESKYEDYGAAIAEKVDIGHVRVFASKMGKIYGVSIIGEGSGEMINEWTLAIQKNISLFSIMMMQHSFPTMSFLSKRIGENWMMGKMGSNFLQSMCRFIYRFF